MPSGSSAAVEATRRLLDACILDLTDGHDERALRRLEAWTPGGIPFALQTLPEAGIRTARRHLVRGDVDLAEDALRQVRVRFGG